MKKQLQHLKKYGTLLLFFISSVTLAQINDAKVYWVGHSLISSIDNYASSSEGLINLVNTFATSQGKNYDFHKHTIPGAPIGWNWGANATAWNDAEPLIHPLINTSHSDYGTFNVMVVTEGVSVESSYEWWYSPFYARKFFNAAKAANPNTRLFIYESWHHFNAADNDMRGYYGAQSSFNWRNYMVNKARPTWEKIIDEASDPTLTPNAPEYVYQGTTVAATDPGLGDDILDIKIVPTGKALVAVFDRMDANLATDDWSYKGRTLTKNDFFSNPLVNFPTDLTTTVHPGEPIDDIHPSNVLIYLNSLVHYAVIYQHNPSSLPLANEVPENIATIFKEITWNTVLTDERTGVAAALSINKIAEPKEIVIYPNPVSTILHIKNKEQQLYEILDFTGKTVKKGKENQINITSLANGFYLLKLKDKTVKFIKK